MQKSTVVPRLYCRRAQACFILFVRERNLEWMSDWILCILADVEDIPSIFLITWSAKVVSNHTVSTAKYRVKGIMITKTPSMNLPHCVAGVWSTIISFAHINLQICIQKNLAKSHSTLALYFTARKSLSRLDSGLAGLLAWSGGLQACGPGTAAGVGEWRDWFCMASKNAFCSCSNWAGVRFLKFS